MNKIKRVHFQQSKMDSVSIYLSTEPIFLSTPGMDIGFPRLPTFISILCLPAQHQDCVYFQIVATSHLWSSYGSLYFVWAPITYRFIPALILTSLITASLFRLQCCEYFHCMICVCSVADPSFPFSLLLIFVGFSLLYRT